MMHPASDEPEARKRASDFMEFAEAATANESYVSAKGRLSCSTNQAETRKSLFEELASFTFPSVRIGLS